METQNVTLALPKEILRKVKSIAAKRRTSISGLLTRALEDMVSQEEGYELARQRHLARLDSNIDLGTGGIIAWKRADLHDRRWCLSVRNGEDTLRASTPRFR